MTGKEVQKWADGAMYDSEPLPEGRTADDGPTVTVLNMPHDPLGAIAAATMLYEGKVVRDLSEVTDEQRRHYFAENLKTTLRTPFEFVTLHFFVEGVTRAITHQQVRQRTATFVQESLRFAVVDGEHLGDKVMHPPSLAGTVPEGEFLKGFFPNGLDGVDPSEVGDVIEMYASNEQKNRIDWDRAVLVVGKTYDRVIGRQMPAEDARGLLPHNVVTRDHWRTDLRNLQTELAKRLCTQAQFDWRLVGTAIVQAIREYGENKTYKVIDEKGDLKRRNSYWQFAEIADLFRPPCYLEGSCTFMAKMDRGCTIRDRVEAFSRHGVPSSRWEQDVIVQVATQEEGAKGDDFTIPAIHPAEWLMDPTAARVKADS